MCETHFFVFRLRAQSSCFTHGVREVRPCIDQFTLRTLLVGLCFQLPYLALDSCDCHSRFSQAKLHTFQVYTLYIHNHCSPSFAHFVKKIVRCMWVERVIDARVFLSLSLRSRGRTALVCESSASNTCIEMCTIFFSFFPKSRLGMRVFLYNFQVYSSVY